MEKVTADMTFRMKKIDGVLTNEELVQAIDQAHLLICTTATGPSLEAVRNHFAVLLSEQQKRAAAGTNQFADLNMEAFEMIIENIEAHIRREGAPKEPV